MSHCVLLESVISGPDTKGDLLCLTSRMQNIKTQNAQTADKYRADKQTGIFEGKAVIRNL